MQAPATVFFGISVQIPPKRHKDGLTRATGVHSDSKHAAMAMGFTAVKGFTSTSALLNGNISTFRPYKYITLIP